jgi:hypothetical protein|tara:strand:- start:265 stop:474 length:210 start_codon:yes stop_codon:yes gene_type:complete
MATRITKEEALSFLLNHLVIEQGQSITLDQMSLFELMTIATLGAEKINKEEEAIPHEVLQELAGSFGSD